MRLGSRPTMIAGGAASADAEVTFLDEGWNRLCRVDPAAGRPRAQVVFVHGLSEHAGRPLPFARRLAGAGYRTLIPELAGHGARSTPSGAELSIYRGYATTDDAGAMLERIRRETSRRGGRWHGIAEYQYTAMSSADAELHLRQIAAALETARRLDPTLPVFLVGHSMGGLLSLEAAWRWSERPSVDLRGVALLSPALEPTPPRGKPLETLVLETAWKLRDLPFSPLRGAVKGLLRLNLPIDTTAGNRWVSDQPEEVALYAADPLIPHRLPSRYLSSIETLMASTARRGARLPVAALVVVPERDGITSADAGMRLARAVQRELGRERMQLERFMGLCAHDLLRSSARDRVRLRIQEWIERSLAASSHRAA